MIFKNHKVYDILVWVVQVVLPALATLYAGLAVIWNFPYGEQIVGTITLVATFLGTILKVGNERYKKEQAERAERLKNL